MRILSPAISQLARLRMGRIAYFMQYPVQVQQQVFQNLISAAQYTEFGKQYGFSKIYKIEEYKQRVPIHTYDTIKPYIQRTMEGQQNVLWNTPIKWFAKSSGTTADKSKFIPVTVESLDECHYRSGRDVISLYYNNFPDSDVFTGKSLVIGGSHQVNKLSENSDSYFGDLSAVMLQNMPFYGNMIRTPDLEIALMDEWEEKIERMANAVIHENVTSIAGVPTWTIVLIKRIFELTGTDNLADVWPNLELYMHGGVSFTPYREQFRKLIRKPLMHYQETYNASEGFFAAQDVIGEDGLLLFLNHGIFYEFMPMEELGKEEPRTLQLQEVELGKNYALVISTNGGLWRYMVGDTIQFTSLIPYRIKVSGRTKSFINAFGEEVIVENSDTAIAKAAEATGAVVNDYTAAPVYFSDHGNGGHEWLVEFEVAPDDISRFTTILDNTLKAINSDYEAKRYKDIALHMPLIHVLPAGTFCEFLKSKGKLGGQHKVPRLNNDRNYLEEILKFAADNMNA
ncbi:GH3 auxin-responsive promoter family protein [Chitinophaga polysaccharea]|uniref:GH3 auxin-responsive promoter family protein n=1 Tax=Chitinophaga polysaccharea TaxID=1293035 RepID=UPI001455889E|nr:GH3 auxin-responsive promoter family protein [Chitinophaga polysaccharea]NLR59957.1 GH3 auxin-responsive promoter family protein [Chitinophaga polysaccharea]